jgi:hypothetical protein
MEHGRVGDVEHWEQEGYGRVMNAGRSGGREHGGTEDGEMEEQEGGKS